MPEVERWQATKLNYSHEALIDQIIAHPTATNGELALVFSRTPTWVSLVKNSDMFKEALIKRRSEVTDPILIANVEERLEMLTSRSLEVLNEKMARPSADIPDNLALAAAALGAKGMALGGFSSRPPPVPSAPAPNRLENLATRLLTLGTPAHKEIIDATFREVASSPLSPA